MTDLPAALQRTRDVSDALRLLETRGWSCHRTLSVVSASRTGSDPSALITEVVGGQVTFDSVVATGVFGDASLTVAFDSSGNRTVARQSSVDITRTFGRSLADAAQDAWAGDVDSALSLPGTWTVVVEQDLSARLAAVEPAFAWQVLPTIIDLEALFAGVPVWCLGPLIDQAKPIVFVVEHLGIGQALRLGRSAVVSLADDAAALDAINALRAQAPSQRNIPELTLAASPFALAPCVRTGGDLAALESLMWSRCATMSWVELGTSVRLDPRQSSITIEIFGLQRVAHEVGLAGISLKDEEARRAYELFNWASGSGALDQSLAVQQVASLYRDVPPWEKSSDVFDAAIAVFSSLRRDAVSEVLLARRAARTFVIDVAQRTTEQVATNARSTVERFVATLLAVGGVIIAETTKAITEGQATDLRGLLAIFLLGLVVWNLAIEGPAVSSPLKNLDGDLDVVADLLTSRERIEIRQLGAVTSASRQVTVIRWAVPVVYLIAAVTAWSIH